MMMMKNTHLTNCKFFGEYVRVIPLKVKFVTQHDCKKCIISEENLVL